MDPQQIMAMVQYLLANGDPDGAKDWLDVLNTQFLVEGKERDAFADPYSLARASVGPAAYNPAAFEPTREFVAPYSSRARALDESGLGETWSLEDYALANMSQGLSSSQIQAQIMQALTDPATPELQALAAVAERELLPVYDDLGKPLEGRWDFEDMRTRLRDLEDRIFEERSTLGGAMYDPAGGYYTETPSDAAAIFLERGLPLPTEQYSLGGFMDQVTPGWSQITQGRTGPEYLRSRLPTERPDGSLGDRGPLRDAYEAGRRAVLDIATRRAAMRGPLDIQYTGERTPDERAGIQARRNVSGLDNVGGPVTVKSLPPTGGRDLFEMARNATNEYTSQRDALYGDTYLRNAALDIVLRNQGRNPLLDTVSGTTGPGPISDSDRRAWQEFLMNDTWQGEGIKSEQEKFQKSRRGTQKASAATLASLRKQSGSR